MSARLSSLMYGLLCFAVGITVGYLLSWTVEPQRAGDIERVADGTPAASPDVARTPSATLRVPNRDAAPTAVQARIAQAGPAPYPNASSTPRGHSLFAAIGWVEVQADERLTNALVYVLPAGAPGVEDSEGIICVPLDGDKPTRFVIPKPGTYDIGVIVPRHGASMVRDVVVEAGKTTPVRLDVPRPGTISFSLTGDALPESAVVVTNMRPIQSAALAFPGRGQSAQGRSESVTLRGNQTINVPLGARYRLALVAKHRRASGYRHTREFTITPSKRFADEGDHITLTIKRQCAVRVSLRASERPGYLTASLVRGKKRIQRVQFNTRKQPVADTVLWGPPGPMILRWFGAYWESGSIKVDLHSDSIVDATINPVPRTPRKPPVRVPRQPKDVDEAITRIRLPPATQPDQYMKIATMIRNSDGELHVEEWSTSRPEFEMDDEDFASHVSIIRGNEIADHVEIHKCRTNEITLETGGYLLAVYAGPFPVNLEQQRITVQRANGTLLWWRHLENESGSEPGQRANIRIGTIIGPLPPGPHTFHVRSGGILLGSVRATVKPDSIGPLVIR